MSNFLPRALMRGALAASAAVAAVPAAAQTVLPPVAVQTEADDTLLPPSTLDGTPLDFRRTGTSDTASLLRDLPGAGSAAAGGVSSLPVLHGLADDRLKTLVDGMPITAACPNHMNPALSYVDPTNVGKVQAWAGITPVSLGGDSIGGTIAVESASPFFAQAGQGVRTTGHLSAFMRSGANSVGGSGAATMADDTYSLGYTGAWAKAANYHEGGDGTAIRSTRYETMNHALTAAMKAGGNLLTLQAGQQFIPYEAFANQRMDLTGNHSNFVNGRFQGQFGWGGLEAGAYWRSVGHKMNHLNPDNTNYMPMETEGTEAGYTVKADLPLNARDTVRVGNELHAQRLNDWWDPLSSGGMSPYTFLNLNEAWRTRLGTFAEWEARWNPAWTTLLGVRNDMVWMGTGYVAGYNRTANSYATDADTFNALEHGKTDANFDLTALARWEPDQTSTGELGYARKTRSPNLYERYAWSTGSMASSMVTWFGDANGYVGSPSLKPEVAHTLSLSAGKHDAARDWEVKLTPYFTYVRDYINANVVGTIGNSLPRLQFANHDAELYGTDLSGRTRLWEDPAAGRFGLSGTAGWVRGFQVNNGNSLYHMMPLNARVALDHTLGGWSSTAEVQMVASKSQADPLRMEPGTPGYALVNLRTAYEWENLRLDLGIENLFDHLYYQPLGGVDYSDWNKAGKPGLPGALPGMGRSFDAGVTVKF